MISKTKIFRSLILAVFALVCGLSAQRASASHVAAADLYLDYIGTGPTNFKYKVTLVVYKACEPNNALLDTFTTVNFTSSCWGGFSQTVVERTPPDTLDQLCANFSPVNACRVPGSVWPAFERRIYTDTVTFSSACADTKVNWTLCCRNQGISNLLNPQNEDLYIECGVNNVAKWNNSTPRFLIDPLPYLCQNQPAFFLNGPLDPNNDSMRTINVQPLNAVPSPINYNGTYSLANPIASTAANPYTVNVNTATATFTPTLTGKFVLAFKCEEWDRFTGDKIGFITRDVQVSVLNCLAAPPSIDSMPISLNGANWVPTPPSGGFVVACPGAPFSFTATATSQTVSNSVYMTSNNLAAAPGSTFTVANNGLSNPSCTFSWTPSGLDIGDHTIIITAKDSTCNNNQPIVLKNYLVVFIKVLPGVDGGPDGKICGLDGTPWQFNVTGPPNVNYIWTSLSGGNPIGLSNPNIPNPTAYPPYDFTYVVYTPNLTSNCKNRDTMTIKIDTSNAVKTIPDFTICRPGYVQLGATGIGLQPLQNLDCGIDNPINCPYPDSLEIRTQFSGGVVAGSNTVTPFSGNYKTARTQFLLTQSDLYSYGLRSSTLSSIAFDVLVPTPTTYSNFTISLKCTDREDLSPNSGGFEPGATLVYNTLTTDPLVFGWNKFVFDHPYNWDSTKNLIVEICYSNTGAGSAATVNAVNAGAPHMIRNYATTGTVSVCQNPNIGTTQVLNSRPTVRFNFCEADTGSFHFDWSPGTFLSDSTVKTPTAYIPQTTTYYVITRGRNGCKVKDSVKVSIPVHHVDAYPKESTICSDQSVTMTASGGVAYKWYANGDFSAAPITLNTNTGNTVIASPKQDVTYAVVIDDGIQCYDTLYTHVKVNQKPVVNIINSDTTIKYGQNIQLLVSGAYLYSWSPLSTLTNPNIVNPFASPTEPTTYYVQGLAENGCRNVDSVHINIDYRDNLFVPSAFTPNGDAKNDVFRITNLTFQRLEEFRVFNRWGQEIFSTTDVKKGWDGTWKGVPQDMGSYQYLIRVAYPDGYIETYKGNVTLIR